MQYNNPVIRGFNPDPSVCRVGEDYYLVTSSFEFFPGVPVYHSKNLADWTLVNYCLSDEAQLNLQNARASGGIYAPTIRHHDGRFYMTTTNVTLEKNFIVHTDDVRGKWSAPVWVNQSGIDPSMLFEDGTCYYCSNGYDDDSCFIQLSEIDPLTGAFIHEPVAICRGTGGIYPEAPHLYKINGWYYLMLAEGGTQYGHMETIFRSKNPYGPYEGCARNPILSHRDRAGHPIQCTGHADLLEDHLGNFWLYFLGTRPLGAKHLHNLGRETFLAPVVWDADGFPVVGQDGKVELVMDGPLPAPTEHAEIDFYDDFSAGTPNLHYNFYRNPEAGRYRFDKNQLTLDGRGSQLSEQTASPTFIGIRQTEFSMTAQVTLLLGSLEEGGKIGMSAFYNWSYHYDIYVTMENGSYYACLRKRVHDTEAQAARILLAPSDTVCLRIESDDQCYRFFADEIEIGCGLSVGLCTEQTWPTSFTGTYFGLFAEGGQGTFSDFRVGMRKIDAA